MKQSGWSKIQFDIISR